MADFKKKIYTIATAHLDTSWLWTYEKSIEEYIPDTFRRNMDLLEKYPEYKFNFEGSLRYEILKEYYPDLYEKVKSFIAEGRWNPCGSCYENGDVNIPSPEALTRNILYGNCFFRKEFGTESNDIFIPDCFGFGRALPSVAAHSGLKGFSTCKLPWGSSVDIPFDIGFWTGPDGKGVWCAINPFSYTTIMKDIRNNKRIDDKLNENIKKYGFNRTFVYHGIGDRGGAPHKKSVEATVDAVRANKTSDTEVLSATTKAFFEDIESLSEKEKNSLPIWNSEFLMTRHGTGSYTSRTVTKRWNRRGELLADAAERFSSAAMVHNFASYPQYSIDASWKKLIAHHFHDDITGTSFEECYKRSHNDYVQAMHTFSAEYTSANKAIAHNIDTSFVKGVPIAVSNPLQSKDYRTEAVSAEIDADGELFEVKDKDGNIVPSQTQILPNGKKKVTFLAKVPSCGIAVFDICPAETVDNTDTGLKIYDNTIENKHLKVSIDENGDIASVYSKKLSRELLREPVRMAIHNNVHSFDWPAWEIKYEDIKEKAYLYPTAPEITVNDNGPALCSLRIIRKANDSVFTQIVSLDAESDFVSVYNETDWREEASLLKAQFSLAAENEVARYDIGLGFTQRGNNTEKLYEVPAQKWAAITDSKENFGVAVFSDSRTGWDKPDNSTLRLTCIHTPFANYRHECSQHVMDMGLNRYSFAVYGHDTESDTVSAKADAFCQPMHTFITEKHDGELGKEYSFVKLSNDNVRISAIKKAQESDAVIFRVAEVSGKKQDNVVAEFALPIAEAYEADGSEKILRKIETTDGKLTFFASGNEIKTFALTFDTPAESRKQTQQKLNLTFNGCAITSNENREASTLTGGISIPAEMIADTILSEGIEYDICKDKVNCIVCDGSEIKIPEGYTSLHMLITSLSSDKDIVFKVNNKAVKATVQSHSEPIGLWDLMKSRQTGYIKPYPQAISVSHTHSRKGDIIGQQFYVFHTEISLDGANSVTLPDDKNIIILAATAVKDDYKFKKADAHFDTLSKRPFDYSFSEYAKKHSERKLFEKILDLFTDRTFCIHMVMDGCYNKNSLADLYFIINNLIDKMKYKKNKEKLLESRKTKK